MKFINLLFVVLAFAVFSLAACSSKTDRHDFSDWETSDEDLAEDEESAADGDFELDKDDEVDAVENPELEGDDAELETETADGDDEPEQTDDSDITEDSEYEDGDADEAEVEEPVDNPDDEQAADGDESEAADEDESLTEDEDQQIEDETETETESEAEDYEEVEVCQCQKQADCASGYYCDNCLCVPMTVDGDAETEADETLTVPYCLADLCSQNSDCSAGHFCNLGNCCRECNTDLGCAKYGTSYFCDPGIGKCVLPPADEELPEAEAEKEEGPFCCVSHEECAYYQYCNQDSLECGECRIGCWKDEQCSGGSCDQTKHYCVYEQTDGDATDIETESELTTTASVSGKVYFSAELFADVTKVIINVYDDNPATGKKLAPKYSVQATDFNAGEKWYSYSVKDLPATTYWFYANVSYASRPDESVGSDANPKVLAMGGVYGSVNYYFGIPNPSLGWIKGVVYVDDEDKTRTVKVRLYNQDPYGYLNDGYIAEVAAGNYDDAAKGRPYVFADLRTEYYYVQAYFSDDLTFARDSKANPIHIVLSDPPTAHVENATIYLTSVVPGLGSVTGFIGVNDSLKNLVVKADAYANSTYDPSQIVYTASVGDYDPVNKGFPYAINNMQNGTYYILAQTKFGTTKITGAASVSPLTINLSDPNKINFTGVNCYLDAPSPSAGSVAGKFAADYMYYDYAPTVEVYATANRSGLPIAAKAVYDYDYSSASGTYFVGGLPNGVWYVFGALCSSTKCYYSPYAGPISVSLSGVKDYTGKDIAFNKPSDWGSIRGKVKTGVENETLPVFIGFYQNPFAPEAAPIAEYKIQDGLADGYVNYLLTNIPTGVSYDVVARVDIGADGDKSNDYYGYAPGNPLSFIAGNPPKLHYDEVDMDASAPYAQGEVKGRVYLPPLIADKKVYVKLYKNRPFNAIFGPPVISADYSVEAVRSGLNDYVDYSITPVIDGVYYLDVWCDEDGDGKRVNDLYDYYRVNNVVTSFAVNRAAPVVEKNMYLGVVNPNSRGVSGKVFVGDMADFKQRQLYVQYIDHAVAVSNDFDRYVINWTSVGAYDAGDKSFTYAFNDMPEGTFDMWLAPEYMGIENPAKENPLTIDASAPYHSGINFYYERQYPAYGGSFTGSLSLPASSPAWGYLLWVTSVPMPTNITQSNIPDKLDGSSRAHLIWLIDNENNSANFYYAGTPVASGNYYVYFVALMKCSFGFKPYVIEYAGNPVAVDAMDAAAKDLTGVNGSFSSTVFSCD